MSQTQFVLSIDPGVSTGIALLSFEEDSPAELVQGWQFTGGVAALKDWRKRHWRDAYRDSEWGYDFGPRFSPDPRRFWDLHTETLYEEQYNPDSDDYDLVETEKKNLTVICEKFTARATKGFSYTTASLEPLRGEGALIDREIMPDYSVGEKRWRDPKHQYLVGGEDLPDKKKRMHNFLNDVGMRRTNKDFPDSPTKDGADDFRSACGHGIAYIARELKHKPTFDMISEWTEKN
ncbi:RuvC-like resolvase [Microbacterium phage Cassita]|nr:RuvC-like resolvase [Microbacterium phage Cassita]